MSHDPRPYRGGKIHVVAEKCNTCVFRPRNLMHLNHGRLAELVKDNIEAESALQCHKTLPYSPEGYDGAVCRGFFDAYAMDTPPLRLAVALGVLEFDERAGGVG